MKSKQALWLLCVSAVLGLSACGGKGGEEQAPAPQQQASQSQEASQQAESSSQQEAASMDNFLSNAQLCRRQKILSKPCRSSLARN